MPSQGPSLGTVALSVPYAGTDRAWASPSNVTNAGTSPATSYLPTNNNEKTEQLKITGLNFSIPANAIIDNIEVIFRSSNGAGGMVIPPPGPISGSDFVRTNLIQLVKANIIVGNNLAALNPVTIWSTNPPGNASDSGNISYSGSPADWGITLTAADVNSSTFGAVIRAINPSLYFEIAVGLYKIWIKVTYTELPTTVVDIQSFISLDIGTSKDIGAAISLQRITSIDVTAFISLGFGITVISPALDCPTFTDANVPITWTISQGVQASFRVQVFRDILGQQIVYDSGTQSGSLSSWTIPPGVIPAPETLYVRISVTNTSGGSGSSAFTCFKTSFPTSVNVTGLTVKTVGGCDAPEILPGIRITYSQIVPGGGETFSRYGIRRRMAGETNFILIAEVYAIDTLRYHDYNVMPRQRYEYAVIWIAKSGSAFLVSSNQASNPGTQVDFDFNFLHTANINSAAPEFLWIRADSWDSTINVKQDIKYVQPWGRDLPTVHVGQALGVEITLPLFDRLQSDSVFWRKITDMILAQRDLAAVLCLRLGRGRQIYFGTISTSSRNNQQKTYGSSLQITESYFDEDLTPGLHSGIGSGGLGNNNG